MKKLLVLSSLLLGLFATSASAQIIDIGWGDLGPGCSSPSSVDRMATFETLTFMDEFKRYWAKDEEE